MTNNLHSRQVGINCSFTVFGMNDAEYVDVVSGIKYLNTILIFIIIRTA